jgi:hypothetical protein
MNTNKYIAVWLLVAVFGLAGCATTPYEGVFETTSAVELRSYQSRVFDTTDRERTLRTIIAALQDLGFVIDKADATLGMISATKLDNYELRVTATVRPRGETQLIVRMNATQAHQPVDDPAPYQDWFVVLEKAMFLTAHQVD